MQTAKIQQNKKEKKKKKTFQFKNAFLFFLYINIFFFE